MSFFRLSRSIVRHISALSVRAHPVIALIAVCIAGIFTSSTVHAGTYGGNKSPTITINYLTNSAGLTDYRKFTVTVSFTSSAPNSEGIYNGSLSVNGAGASAGGGIPTIYSGTTGSVSYTSGEVFTTTPNQTITATASFKTWNHGGGGEGDQLWSITTTASSGPATNTTGTATFTFSGSPFTYDGGQKTLTVTANPSHAGALASGHSGISAGNYTATATTTNPDFTGSATYNWTINKGNFPAPTASNSTATPGQSWTPPFGPPFAAPGYAWVVAGRTSWAGTSWTPPASDAGQSLQFYVAGIGDQANWNGTTDPSVPGKVLVMSGPYTVTVAKANQTINFPNPGTRSYGSPFGLSASASSGLPVSYTLVSGPATISGSTVTPTGTGSVTIRASQPGNSQYNAAPDVTQTFTISKANASVTLGNLSHTYTGSPCAASVSTSPGGLSTTVTYNGSGTAPTNAGSYSVVATINDANYQGSASGTLVISPRAVTFSFSGGPSYYYSGGSQGVTVTANPAGATFNTGGTYSATSLGNYTATATAYGNYSGSGSYNWQIYGTPVAFSFAGGPYTYDGTPKFVVVTPNPGNATHSTAGTSAVNAGNYTAVANGTGAFTGSGSYSWTINPAPVTFTFTGGPFVYDGTTKSVSVTPLPANATYNTSGMSAMNAGTYTATASATGNYGGTGTYTWTIAKADQTSNVSISPETRTIVARSTVTFTASGGSGTGDYVWGGAATGTGTTKSVTFNTPGTYTVTVYRAADGNYNVSNTATATITVDPYPATAELTGTTNFGSVYRDAQVGTPTSSSRNFTIANTGDAPLTVTGASTTGKFFVTTAPGFPVVLNGGTSATITVTFTPGTSIGANSGALTVFTSATNPSLSLTGTCLAPSISITWD